MDKDIRPYLAELIGTFALVFVGAGSVCAYQLAASSGQGPGLPIGVALAEGFILAVALAATVHLSGGYLNPAITLALYVYKRFEFGKTAGLIFVQLVGAIAAGGLVRLLFFREDVLRDARLGTPHVNGAAFGVSGVNIKALFCGIGIELVLTFIFTFIVFATLIDPRAPKLLGRLGKWLSTLWVGLTLAALVLVAFPYTGAAMNPARYFGTALWELTVPSLRVTEPIARTQGTFADHMVYWIGPIVGALLAGGAYIYLILPQQAERAPAAGTTAITPKAPAGALSRSKR